MKNTILLLLSIFMYTNFYSQDSAAKIPSLISKEEKEYVKAVNKLNLTDEQKAKLKSIRQNRKQAIKSRQEENKEFRQNINKKTESEIKEVLTPEQQAELAKIKEQRKKERIENGKNHHGGKGRAKYVHRNKKGKKLNQSSPDSTAPAAN